LTSRPGRRRPRACRLALEVREERCQPSVFNFSTGNPDGFVATASRPGTAKKTEIESADDFILANETVLDRVTFTGLLPTGMPLSNVREVKVEMYRVFPNDSTNPPDGRVPTRTISPSDVEFDDRDSSRHNRQFDI
jgi:hypothetical protein